MCENHASVILITFQVEQNDKGEDGEDENSPHKGRRHIHKLLQGQKLLDETKAAAKAEKDRRERIKKEHQKVICRFCVHSNRPYHPLFLVVF